MENSRESNVFQEENPEFYKIDNSTQNRDLRRSINAL